MKTDIKKSIETTEHDIDRVARIKALMSKHKVRQVDLALATGSTRGTVSKWISGVNVPTKDYLTALCRTLKTNPDWIILGKGVSSDTIDDDTNTFFKAPIYEELKITSFVHNGKYVRLSASLAINAGASISDTYCYTNTGHRMSPNITHGAECLVDGSKTEVREGKTYLIEYGTQLTIRNISTQPNGSLLLKSINTEYDDDVIERCSLSNLKILGWVYRVSNLEKW